MGHRSRWPGDCRSHVPQGSRCGQQGPGYSSATVLSSDVETIGYAHSQWLCPLSFLLSSQSLRGHFSCSTTSILNSVMALWLCLSTLSRPGPWTSSALGAFKPGFQINTPLSLNENCRMPTCQADPSGLSHVWRGQASLATLHPLPSPCQIASNIANPAQLFCHTREGQRRGVCSEPYPHLPRESDRTRVELPDEHFQAQMHS